MSETGGTLAKKKNPEPPPSQGHRDFAKAVGIGRATIYKLIPEGRSAPSKSLDPSL